MAEKIFTVDKFLGLNEAADGSTELKMGEASKIENFYITDDFNLKSRPGIVRALQNVHATITVDGEAVEVEYERIFPCYINGSSWLVGLYINTNTGRRCAHFTDGSLSMQYDYPAQDVCTVYLLGGVTYILARTADTGKLHAHSINTSAEAPDNWFYEQVDPYVPLVLTGCAPSGGGTELEPMNILSDRILITFSADGESAEYVLPDSVSVVEAVTGAGKSGSFDSDDHTYSFEEPPENGLVVEFLCTVEDEDLKNARERFLKMSRYEYFNGATDTRIFFYGDGTNLCYYTGTPSEGQSLKGLYIPAGNELSVDFSDSPITGLIRHYSRLLAFKPDGVDAITYEPVTLADGRVIAGFYLRPVSRAFGNNAPGQICLINNNPRSFTGGSLYEWRITSYSYRDERYAKNISQKVARSLAAADPEKLVAVDHDGDKTQYIFLNDENGTVLVDRYDLEAWSIYRSDLTVGVTQAVIYEGKLLFLKDGKLFTFDAEAAFDDGTTAIDAVWESGYMAFGADYQRKYSSNLWISMLPEVGSKMDITVQTDRQDEYLVKSTGMNLFSWENMDFSNFSFLLSHAPKIKRIKLKVKKFVYYKLIFRLSHGGARATVLGYDQQVRYSSSVK